MQSIPVDMARLGSAMCVVPPEPRMTPDGEVRKDREGNPVWVVGVSVRQQSTRRADVIEVAVSGQPQGITEGARLTVVDLVATSWEIEGRRGISFRASAVRPEVSPPAATGGSSGRGKSAAGGDA
ncbi:SCO3933 family regulatory protein [Streptomyces sp. NPDC055037]